MMREKRSLLNQSLPWIIFVVAFSLRLLLLHGHPFRLAYEEHGFPKSDARTYDVIAMNVLNGRGFGVYLSGFRYSSPVAPFYPLFLAFIYSFFGHNYMAVKIAQLLIGSLNAVLVYGIGKRLFTRQVGIISGLVFACYLPHIWWTSPLMRESFSTFALALAYLSMLKAMDEPSVKNYAFAGISIGIAILTRGQLIVLLPTLIVCSFIGYVRKTFFSSKDMLMILIFAVIAISPWVIRSLVLHHGTIIIESSAARQFWTGANPKYQGLFYSRDAWHEVHWGKPFESEGERYRRLVQQGLKFIRENPGLYSEYFRRRLREFWHVERLNVLSFDLGGIGTFILYAVTFFGFIGATCAFFQSPRSMPILLVILLYTLGSGISGSFVRYRLPLEQFLVIFAAYTIHLISQIRLKDWRATYAGLSLPPRTPVVPETPGMQLSKDATRQKLSGSTATRFLAFFKGLSTVLILIFVIRLSIAYLGSGEKIVEPHVGEEQIQLALEKHGLLQRWHEQARDLTYEDVFNDQAQNGGYVTRYNKFIVIWKGRMEYIIGDTNGNIANFSFVLDPSPHDFKQGFGVSPVPGFAVKAKNFSEGDVAYIIARISTTHRALADPCVQYYDILK